MQHLRDALAEITRMERQVKKLEESVADKNVVIDSLKKARAKRSIQWDEATIAEHDKERGTRMKIDEPKTPYVRDQPLEFPTDDRTVPTLASSSSSAVRVTPYVHRQGRRLDGQENASESEEADGDGEENVRENEIATPATTTSAPRLGRPMKLDLNLLNANVDDDEAKKDEFAKVRAKHYDEFRKLRELRERGLSLDDEEDEEDGEEESA